MSGSAIEKMIEQQKRYEELASGGAIEKMIEQQKKFEGRLKRFQNADDEDPNDSSDD